MFYKILKYNIVPRQLWHMSMEWLILNFSFWQIKYSWTFMIFLHKILLGDILEL
jgi:hypothetical protein